MITLLVCSYELLSQKSDASIVVRVDSLIEISRGYRSQREFQKALDILGLAEQICVNGKAGNSESFANCLFNYGLVFYDNQKFKEAEESFIKARDLYARLFGKEHDKYANCLKNLSNIYFDLGDYAQSELMNLEEMKILEKTTGKENSKYVTSISNLASLYAKIGLYEKAESLNLEAVAISGRIAGKKSAEYIDACTNLGILYFDKARYEDAEPIFIQVMKLREEVFGNQDISFSASMNNLGLLYETMGNYPAAESMYLRCREITEKVLGKDHSDYIMILQNLANLYWHWGDYKKCESLNLEAKEVFEKTMGKEHPDYALSLDNLGSLYQTLGVFDKAEQLYLQAINIREKTLGKNHPSYAAGIYSLASLYKTQGNHVKAEQLYLDAINTIGIAFGKKHPNYALGLSNLASLYIDRGQHEKAEKLLLECAEIQEEAVGGAHPDYATSLNSLADLYSTMRRYNEAEKLYLRVLDIRGKKLGKEHTEYAQTLKGLAEVYENENRFDESESLLGNYQRIVQKNLRKSVTFLSVQELQKYISQDKSDQSLFLYWHIRKSGNKHEGSLPSLFYDQSLFQKGFLQNAAFTLNLQVGQDQEAMNLDKILKSSRRLLAKEYSLPYAERDSILIKELEKKADDAEKKLASRIEGYDDAIRESTWSDVKVALSRMSAMEKTNAAAIEFVHYPLMNDRGQRKVYYCALIVRPESEQPALVDLFEESALDSILKSGHELKVMTELLYAARGATPVENANVFSKDLYSLIWQPVVKELEGIQKIYFSSAGRMNQLNLTAIHCDQSGVMSDKFRLIQVGSTRQLTQIRAYKINNKNAVLFGGIQYDADTVELSKFAIRERQTNPSALRGEFGFSTTASEMRIGHWNYLGGTEEEISNLEKLIRNYHMNVRTFRKLEAREEVFKNIHEEGIGSPKIIHLATHGYFFLSLTDRFSHMM